MPARPFVSALVVLLGAGALLPDMVLGQSFTYAVECVTNVDNATVHVPAEPAPSLPDGTPVAAGDTIAVYTDEGTCAGYGVWMDGEGATLAAAGSDSIDVSPDGYASGASLQFEVFDVSEETAVDLGPAAFAACEDVGVSVCAEGDYADGTYHTVTGFQHDPVETVTRAITLAEGWNFVSVPVASDASFDTLFPECSGGFLYVPGEGYTSIAGGEPLAAGTGAAVECQPDSTTVTGEVASSSIEVKAGWNLIGGLDDTVSVSAVATSPAAILTSEVFRLPAGEGYTSTPVLRPGEGYWVKAAEAGTIDVSGAKGTLVDGPETSGDGPADVTRLSIVDAGGRQSTLRLREGLTDPQRRRSELPPVPPGEVFDVRFASGHAAAPLASGKASATEHAVQIQGAAFPVEVQLETDGGDRRLEISAGTQRHVLSAAQPTAQIQQSTGRIGVTAAPAPEEFRLGKASPNPVRRSAELEYTLPEQSDVSIVVYDVLGRRVAQLVDAKHETGVHRARVGAGTLPSGKYFVRMRAGPFRQTRQLTVVR
ncbi:T9SS type A sorting domain-containing protein [Salinibacter altiplanensis]|uniref:T9SS type A sorting domain-containing protein n=1 Tax=Salinibacter altiplanensis TaxID=1803181 RepID=UPI000C9ECBFA|nr:T9SS type A sorting domain-containing protein [Salinibacter altiplanensis]